jgi:SM-20-related protein
VRYIDLGLLEASPLRREPYEYVVVPNFVPNSVHELVVGDFPAVPGPGSHPLSTLDIRGHFAGLVQDLEAPPFRHAVETKFGIDLTGRPTMYTVRGYTRLKDGQVHTDASSKIVTVLLYLNSDWAPESGRLRILRNGHDLDDYVEEIPPTNGTLLVFRRSDRSWHGHKPYAGQRRAIQMNWVTDQSVVDNEQRRLWFSTKIKQMGSWLHG